MRATTTVGFAAMLGLVVATRGLHAGVEHRSPIVHTRQFSALTYEGCYSSAGSLSKNSSYQYNTQGYCQEQCVPAGFKVEGVTVGKDCYCGNELPPSSSKVDDTKCNTPCAGFGENNCGGSGFFSVYLTGLDDTSVNTATADSDTDSSSSSASTSATTPSTTASASPSVVTIGEKTMTVTAGATTSSAAPKSSSSGGSKVGIAVGVVVGIVAIAAIAGGGYLIWRRKQKRELLEEHQKAASASGFTPNGRSPAMSAAGVSFDSHLDPSIMASNRLSNGSLADNADYSRRILKVTNA